CGGTWRGSAMPKPESVAGSAPSAARTRLRDSARQDAEILFLDSALDRTRRCAESRVAIPGIRSIYELRRWFCGAGADQEPSRLSPHGAQGRQGLARSWRARRGKHTSFPQSVKLKAGETVVFSW